jgi:hypothetical protein
MLEEPTLMRDICFLGVWMLNHWADLSWWAQYARSRSIRPLRKIKLGHARSHDDIRSIAPGPCAGTHAMVCCVAKASAPIPKFATAWGTLRCELWNRQDTSNSMTLVRV